MKRWWEYAITVGVCVSLIGGSVLVKNAITQANNLRDGLIFSCEKNGNPLREAQRARIKLDIEDYKDEIREDVRFLRNEKLAAQAFPFLSDQKLTRLVRRGIRETRGDIRDQRGALPATEPVDCTALYST
jgi:hypothetical protein